MWIGLSKERKKKIYRYFEISFSCFGPFGVWGVTVVKYFDLPENIMSDRDSHFIGRFWTVLFGLLGSQLKFSTTNHPQTNGQTKRINAVLEDYLRHYVTTSQKNWLDLLDLAQFAYNLHKSSSTEMSPFEFAMRQPRLHIYIYIYPTFRGPRSKKNKIK